MKNQMQPQARADPQICGLNLTEEHGLDLFLSQNQPYIISVHNDPYKFCGAMATRQNDEEGEIIFGRAEFARSIMRNCYVGILEKPQENAAIAIHHSGQCAVHIYIPT